MAASLADYETLVGREVVDELRAVAGYLRGRRLQHINSTAVGGGVAEILMRVVPFLQELGVETSWEVLKGDDVFFEVTKDFHNALHGRPVQAHPERFDIYNRTIEANLPTLPLGDDVIIVHDPQPAGLIGMRHVRGRRWIWRCHIDVSRPDPQIWDFLRPMVERYDLAVFSMPEFARPLSIPQYMVAPSIDPLSDKNRELDRTLVQKVLSEHGVDPRRPVMTQISRFDRLKDPLGVLAAYKLVRKRHDCQLILAGGGASDDPEGEEVLNEVRERAAGDADIHVLLLPPFADLTINALVRGSTVVLQKSLREGFGLTVSEALWKRRPVIGGAVGGIRLQVIDGVTGFLVHSVEGAAHRTMHLLSDAKLRRRMGQNGYEHVKQNFLITRHLKDLLLLMLAADHRSEHIVHLR